MPVAADKRGSRRRSIVCVKGDAAAQRETGLTNEEVHVLHVRLLLSLLVHHVRDQAAQRRKLVRPSHTTLDDSAPRHDELRLVVAGETHLRVAEQQRDFSTVISRPEAAGRSCTHPVPLSMTHGGLRADIANDRCQKQGRGERAAPEPNERRGLAGSARGTGCLCA